MSQLPSRFVRRKPQDPFTRVDEALAFDDSWRPPDWFSHVAIVLVEPTDVVNIGGVIRAMGNTGFVQLRLVKPVEFTEWQIIGVAHYTQHILAAAEYFETLAQAAADRQLVIGLTGKHHRVKRNQLRLPRRRDDPDQPWLPIAQPGSGGAAGAVPGLSTCRRRRAGLPQAAEERS